MYMPVVSLYSPSDFPLFICGYPFIPLPSRLSITTSFLFYPTSAPYSFSRVQTPRVVPCLFSGCKDRLTRSNPTL